MTDERAAPGGRPAPMTAGGSPIEWTDYYGDVHRWGTVDDWASAWWMEWRARLPLLDRPDNGPRPVRRFEAWPAMCFLHETVERDGQVAVRFIAALADLAESEEDLGNVGAGDLEDLVVHSDVCSDEVVQELEDAAADHPNLAVAISHMWVSASVPEPRRSRLLALGGIDVR